MGPGILWEEIDEAGFQSTHPVWDGTSLLGFRLIRSLFQSTHPVWDGTELRAAFQGRI